MQEVVDDSKVAAAAAAAAEAVSVLLLLPPFVVAALRVASWRMMRCGKTLCDWPFGAGVRYRFANRPACAIRLLACLQEARKQESAAEAAAAWGISLVTESTVDADAGPSASVSGIGGANAGAGGDGGGSSGVTVQAKFLRAEEVRGAMFLLLMFWSVMCSVTWTVM